MNLMIKKYVNHIQDFDTFLREEYGFKDSYTNHIGRAVPKKGKSLKRGIEEWLFHGGGCSLYFDNDLEIHWDFAPLDVEGIKTSPWKFFTFIVTFYKAEGKESSLIEQDVADYLKLLAKKGEIDKLPIGNAFYCIGI